VGVMKQKYAGKYIRVAGFTDTDPIKRSTFKSNYHLGFDRAYSVREFLVGKGLDGKTISLSSFGPDVPLKTKEQSRRVEVIVVD
jgi:flagellar motor protein MotB